ncbi:Os05g0447250, partial [Oryza sativa Japonica Group]
LVARRSRQGRPGVRPGWALVALGEEPERVDLLDEVGDAGPAAEAEPDHQHPRHHEHVHHEHPAPARQERRRLLRRIQSGGGGAVREDVGEGGDDVDGEADEERADGGVDGAEEGEDDGEEPDGHDDGEAGERAGEDAAGAVHADRLLPHEVERGAREPERDELVDQHQDHRRVAPPGPRQQREGVRVRQQRVAERPVHGRRRRQRQREHVQRRHQVDVLELLRLPHRCTYTVTACPPKV